MKIKLNSDVDIDLSKLIESRLLVQANSGGGKSWAIRRIIEQTFGKVQIIVLDPEGEFTNLREEYDFVFAGKDGDAVAEPRTASLLAKRLLELKASAIIDLYELNPQERKHFVRLFCEAMVNAPKELWHDCLVIIDEAHVFAPEKGESEAMGPVIDLATRGRKRGYCVVLATQRIPKLNKDAAAECNNKLIGRASQDIDRKRAAEELGFTTKEQILSLRDLEPGEFYVFGPAISRDVIKTTIGDVKVKPPLRGQVKHAPPPPTEKVKKILAQLADLPQEAAKEAKTISELKKENVQLKRELTTVKRPPREADSMQVEKAVEVAIKKRDREWEGKVRESNSEIARLGKIIVQATRILGAESNLTTAVIEAPSATTPATRPVLAPQEKPFVEADQEPPKDAGTLSKGARSILSYLHQVYPHWKTKAQLWVAAGYAPGGGFNNLVYELTGAGLIEKDGTGNYASLERHDPSMVDAHFDASLDKWYPKLSSGAGKIMRLLLDDPNLALSKEEIASQTGYALGGGFNNLIYELTGKEIIVKTGSQYIFNPKMLDL